MPSSGRNSKIAIVGAGSVGATLAYACLIRGVAHTVALYDVNAAKVEAEVLDLRHGLQFVPRAEVLGSDEIAVCADADVIAVTAGAKQRVGQSRLDLAGTNVDMCRELIPRLLEVAPEAVFVMVTNPVDVLTYAALRFSGLPPHRVLGTGTVLDSSRLRDLIARHAGVAVQNVHALIAGEHGDSEFPLWSSAAIGSVPLRQLSRHGQLVLRAEDERRIAHEVVTAAERIIAGKGATNYAIGLAGARVLEAVIKDECRVLPVTSLLERTDLPEVCLSLPAVVDRTGVQAVLEVPMSEHESELLRRSAAAVRQVADSLGL
ncbi:MAG TPA: L-lactate dehydrogenase [Propionibacteriaceae bacterium]|jgi:L-lactate dehydrogenase